MAGPIVFEILLDLYEALSAQTIKRNFSFEASQNLLK